MTDKTLELINDTLEEAFYEGGNETDDAKRASIYYKFLDKIHRIINDGLC